MLAGKTKKLGYRVLVLGLALSLCACGRLSPLEDPVSAGTHGQPNAKYSLDGRNQETREDKPAIAPKESFILDFLL